MVCDIDRGCITDALLHSSINDHHEHATEQRQLRKDDPAACGAVLVTFSGSTDFQIWTG
jgi:hypothetical protein